MGKPSPQPQFYQPSTVPVKDQSSTSINHFSHPHPLQISNNQSQQNFNVHSCSGCEHKASGVVYNCTMCNYFLHQKCSQMPQKITHPFDQNNHVLSLLPKPAYLEGVFHCDACGQQGKGFSYRCQPCGIDLHILCASMPMTYIHQSHHHQLSLTFLPPYPNQTFSCDLCKMAGSKIWLYHCSICEFDIHLTCVNALPPSGRGPFHEPPIRPSLMNQIQSTMKDTIPQPPTQTIIPSNFINNVNPIGYSSFRPTDMAVPIHLQSQPQLFIATPYSAPVPMQQAYMPPNSCMIKNGAYSQPVMPANYSRQQNTMTNQIVGSVADGIASGICQAAAGALIQGVFGGGG